MRSNYGSACVRLATAGPISHLGMRTVRESKSRVRDWPASNSSACSSTRPFTQATLVVSMPRAFSRRNSTMRLYIAGNTMATTVTAPWPSALSRRNMLQYKWSVPLCITATFGAATRCERCPVQARGYACLDPDCLVKRRRTTLIVQPQEPMSSRSLWTDREEPYGAQA